MYPVTTTNKQTRRIAGFAAVVASLFCIGGTLLLAEHYAQTGTEASEQLAARPAGQDTRVAERQPTVSAAATASL